MPDIAMGRKEIMKALHVASWETICRWKRKDKGFRKIIRRNHITGRPFIVISEAKAFLVNLDNIKSEDRQ